MPLSLFIIYSIRNSCSHTIHLTCIQKRNPSCLSPTEHQNRVSKEILSLHIFSGCSLSCQSPHRELAHPKKHPGVESSVKIGMRRKTRAGNYNFYQQHPLSSIWATSKTTLSPPKGFFGATDKPPSYHSAPELHGLHMWKSMPYCAIQTDFKVKTKYSSPIWY